MLTDFTWSAMLPRMSISSELQRRWKLSWMLDRTFGWRMVLKALQTKRNPNTSCLDLWFCWITWPRICCNISVGRSPIDLEEAEVTSTAARSVNGSMESTALLMVQFGVAIGASPLVCVRFCDTFLAQDPSGCRLWRNVESSIFWRFGGGGEAGALSFLTAMAPRDKCYLARS